MAIQGLRHTDNFVASERPKNWREGILMRQPNGMLPLTGLTSQMKKRVVDDPEFNWWEKETQSRRAALTASIGTGSAVLTVASGALGFKKNDVLYLENTGEQVRVSADPAADTSIPVERSFGDTAATAITYNGAGVNPNFFCIGSAFEEGSLAPTGVNFDPVKVYNYTQIFRSSLEATRTALKTRLRTVEALKEAKRECLEIIGIDMERAILLGEKQETTSNGKPLRTMDGITSFIPSANTKVATTDYASGVTLAGLEEYMYNAFKYGSQEKLALCGNRALLTIQQICRKNSSLELVQGQKEFGMNVMRLVSPFGTLVLKSHPLFNQLAGGTTGTGAYYGMESWMYILDMSEFQYVHLKDSDLQWQSDLQGTGVDGYKGGYLAEISLELHNAKNHYLIKNLVTAAVDS